MILCWGIATFGIVAYIGGAWMYGKAKQTVVESTGLLEAATTQVNECNENITMLSAMMAWHRQHGNHLQCVECYRPLDVRNKEAQFCIKRDRRGVVTIWCRDHAPADAAGVWPDEAA